MFIEGYERELDSYFLFVLLRCTECESCRNGDFVTCQNQKINGITIDGGYAEYCTLWANAT